MVLTQIVVRRTFGPLEKGCSILREILVSNGTRTESDALCQAIAKARESGEDWLVVKSKKNHIHMAIRRAWFTDRKNPRRGAKVIFSVDKDGVVESME